MPRAYTIIYVKNQGFKIPVDSDSKVATLSTIRRRCVDNTRGMHIISLCRAGFERRITMKYVTEM
jgi:hypothetical protein